MSRKENLSAKETNENNNDGEKRPWNNEKSAAEVMKACRQRRNNQLSEKRMKNRRSLKENDSNGVKWHQWRNVKNGENQWKTK
jgi:hypothetical protein